jgi:hypothetical protein
MPYGAVFPGGVHSLEDDEKLPFMTGEEQLLQFA